MTPLATLRRWAAFLEGGRSLAVAAFLAGFRALTPCSLTDVSVPLRVRGVPDPVRCRPGTSDFHTLLQIWDQGEYAAATEFVESPVERVLDLGANVGMASCYFASLWPEARIVAVEPDPGNVGLARRNLTGLERRGRAELIHCFVGAARGVAEPVRDSGEGHNEVRMGPISREAEEGIPVRTVPDLLRGFPGGRVDFLKCDIEGAERELFEGGPAWLRRVDAMVVELHELDPAWLWESVEAAGRSVEKCRIEPVEGYPYTVVWARLGGRVEP